MQSVLAQGCFHAGSAFFIVKNRGSTQPKRFLSAKFLVGLSVLYAKWQYTHQRFFILVYSESLHICFSTPGLNAPNTVCRYCKQEKPRLEDLTRTSEELQALSYEYDQRLIGKTQCIRVRLSHIFVWGQHMTGGK